MLEILQHLGKHIREVRIQKGFSSQEKFADHCGVHRTFMGHVETGRKDFRLSTIIRIAEALGISLSELFAGVETKESPSTRIRSRKVDSYHGVNRAKVLNEVVILERAVNTLRELATIRDT